VLCTRVGERPDGDVVGGARNNIGWKLRTGSADDEHARIQMMVGTHFRALPALARAFVSRWRLHDLFFFTYIAAVLSLLLFFGIGGGTIDNSASLIAAHLLLASLAAIAIIVDARWPRPVTRFLRWWYPLLLCTFCFEAIGQMVHLIEPSLIDARLVAADRWLFGSLPTPLLQAHGRPGLTELMYVCYSSYYFIVPGVGFALYLRGRETNRGDPSAAFRAYVATVSMTFWVCYLHFLFTPAGGPIFWPDYPGPVLELPGGPITTIERWVFQNGTIVGGAFPSSHVAVAFVCACFAVRFSVAAPLLVPLCVGLAISTLYAGYHYGVDVLYGVVVGGVVTLLAGRLFDRLERVRQLGR
jgi:membrane-associated phospholipid phosphatase